MVNVQITNNDEILYLKDQHFFKDVEILGNLIASNVTASITLNGTSLLNTSNGLEINLANANTWTAIQTFPANSIPLSATELAVNTSLVLSTNTLSINLANANTWTAIQTTPASSVNSTQTTILGTTAGSLVCSETDVGPSYKRVVIYADGYENDTTTAQTYTYPTAFSSVAIITINTASIPATTTSLTALSTAPDTTTAYTGLIIIEGY